MKMHATIAAIALTTLLFASHQAHAAAITNLGDKPVIIGIYEGSAIKETTIAPYATFRVPGDITARVHDRDNRIQYDEEFAIWPNGDFGPQRAIVNHYGHN